MVSTWDASNPGSIANKRCRLRKSNPALTSNTRAIATSETTSVRRVNWCPPGVRPELCCAPMCKSLRKACSAGINPTTRPMSAVMTSAKANTVPSRRIAFTRGSSGGLSATSARIPTCATTIPKTPPSMASSRLSVSNCRTSRARGAPSAARIENSPSRCAPRASRRFVTFTQAIKRTRITAPRTASNAGLTPLPTSSCSEFAMTPRSRDAQAGRGNSGSGVWAIQPRSFLA